MTTIEIFLAGSPEGKARPRFNRATGFAYTPAHTRKFESHLRLAAQDAMGTRAPFEGPVKVEIVAAFPIPVSWPKWRKESALRGEQWATTKPDHDNIAKLTDALNEVVWRDDAQVVDCRTIKIYSDKPGLAITVEELAAVEISHAPRRDRQAEPALDLGVP